MTSFKCLRIALAVAVFSIGAQAQTPADTSVKSLLANPPEFPRAPTVFKDGTHIAPMARTTIFVRDIEASLKLYRDILGMTQMFDNYWAGKGINKIMGTDGKELRATVLMAGESVIGNLGIYQLYNDGTTPPLPVQTPDTRIGDFALIFPTNDIWGLTKKVEEAGYVIVSPPVALIERSGYKQQPLEMMFRDPDGVLVNLVQAGIPE